MTKSTDILEQLMSLIEDRRKNPPEKSYTTHLFRGGVHRIGAKVTEEAAEVVEAAGQSDEAKRHQEVTHEAADLVYHLFVLMVFADVRLDDVAAELARRFGTSGLDEKASRPPKEDYQASQTGTDRFG